jgi:hypothetical protein
MTFYLTKLGDYLLFFLWQTSPTWRNPESICWHGV